MNPLKEISFTQGKARLTLPLRTLDLGFNLCADLFQKPEKQIGMNLVFLAANGFLQREFS